MGFAGAKVQKSRLKSKFASQMPMCIIHFRGFQVLEGECFKIALVYYLCGFISRFMLSQFGAAIIISLLHGLIPSHWLPVVAIGKKSGWTENKVLKVAIYAAIAHALSTVIIGIFLALVGGYLGKAIEGFSKTAPAIILIVLGVWFIYRHYTHHHFHLDPHSRQHKSLIWPILVAMFLSPCMEIEGYFFIIGAQGIQWLLLLSAVYFILSVASIFLWVLLAWKGAQKINAHKWEHSSGIITGMVLILSGLLFWLG